MTAEHGDFDQCRISSRQTRHSRVEESTRCISGNRILLNIHTAKYLVELSKTAPQLIIRRAINAKAKCSFAQISRKPFARPGPIPATGLFGGRQPTKRR